jgi:serine/threonine-protein kinase
MADVFVSYKAEDRSRVRLLVDALEADGFSVWWDAHIGGGANWRRDIEEHLDAATCVIVAWTKRSVGPGGDFVRDEANRARKRGAYLPVRLDSSEPPLGFGEVQAISLKGWQGDRSDPRFRAVAQAVRRRVGGQDIDHVEGPHDRPALSRRALLASGVGMVVLAGIGGWELLKPGRANAKRIAVLPFANLSGDQNQAYFSEGIAEELRSALSRLGMQVIGRASSDAVKNMESKQAAARLGVSNLLTGSVRRSPQMIRINAQLVSGKDGVERWSQTYDRVPDDAIKIQVDIAENVARELSIALGQAGRAAISLGGTADSVAQDLIMQSRELIRDSSNEEASRRAIALADAALARDPTYADAYVTKAFALAVTTGYYSTNADETARGLGMAYAAVNRALEIAPALGSAHAVLAFVHSYRLNFQAAENQARQALKYSPDDPEVLAIVGPLIADIGDGHEGLGLVDRMLSLDPLNSRAYRRKSEILITLRQYQAATGSARRSIELAPEAWSARISTGEGLILLGRNREARSEYALMPSPSGDFARLTGEAIILARTRGAAETERAIARMRQISGIAGSYQYSQVYAQLGDKNHAFAELDNAVAARDPGLRSLKVDPFLDPIRDDPRYAALVRKLNFP